ncbi:MFS transporter [Acinetobacter puyangensis]|uniref:MFS transporter n=1 Tax=Acinetobacter puyangensis TaxID=1096779 RepID=UPI003A4D8BAF
MIFSKTAFFDTSTDLNAQCLSTRLSFFSLGLGTAAWAPLIPFAQQRLHLSHADFGLLLLCMGIGSMLAMPVTGKLIKYIGCKAIIGVAILAIALIVPLLTIFNTALLMAALLFVFGVVVGSLGVAINLQAVMVEKNSPTSLMSGFHGMCSLGGLAGVMLVTALLSIGISPLISAFAISAILLGIGMLAVPHCLTELMDETPVDPVAETKPAQRLPSPYIILMGIVCFIAFLSEGAAMDWSGIYLISEFGINASFAGLAYTFFAITMTLGRFTAQYWLRLWGEKNIISYSAAGAALGLGIIIAAPHWSVALLGYAVLGFGCSNIVPVMFSRVGRQNIMPKAVALSVVSTIAYSGSLSGPALVGFLSEMIGLTTVFMLMAVLLISITVLNRFTQVKA